MHREPPHLKHWRGAGADIALDPGDYEVMELAMGLIPEVRICALVLKWYRSSGLQYPVHDVEQLVRHFPHTKYSGGGHEIHPGEPHDARCSWALDRRRSEASYRSP